ncbi:MAG: enoyl-CoA hydratase [Acidimicrobiales bacterium]
MLVDVEIADRVGTITLNRPEARNALSAEMTELVDQAIVDLDADADVGAIILTGADPAFCAGFDLRALSTEVRSEQQRRQAGPLKHLGLLPEHDTPVIGAINGATVTGGLELAMCCDFLIASDRAQFADTHARVGVMPGGGLTIRLPQLIGVDRARRMSFTGDFIDAPTACAWGLVVEVVPHDGLLDRARELATTIASIPAEYVREVRHLYEDIGGLVGREAWLAESQRSREWMARRFDQSRLARERADIVARGRSQSTAGDAQSS